MNNIGPFVQREEVNWDLPEEPQLAEEKWQEDEQPLKQDHIRALNTENMLNLDQAPDEFEFEDIFIQQIHEEAAKKALNRNNELEDEGNYGLLDLSTYKINIVENPYDVEYESGIDVFKYWFPMSRLDLICEKRTHYYQFLQSYKRLSVEEFVLWMRMPGHSLDLLQFLIDYDLIQDLPSFFWYQLGVLGFSEMYNIKAFDSYDFSEMIEIALQHPDLMDENGKLSLAKLTPTTTIFKEKLWCGELNTIFDGYFLCKCYFVLSKLTKPLPANLLPAIQQHYEMLAAKPEFSLDNPTSAFQAREFEYLRKSQLPDHFSFTKEFDEIEEKLQKERELAEEKEMESDQTDNILFTSSLLFEDISKKSKKSSRSATEDYWEFKTHQSAHRPLAKLSKRFNDVCRLLGSSEQSMTRNYSSANPVPFYYNLLKLVKAHAEVYPPKSKVLKQMQTNRKESNKITVKTLMKLHKMMKANKRR